MDELVGLSMLMARYGIAYRAQVDAMRRLEKAKLAYECAVESTGRAQGALLQHVMDIQRPPTLTLEPGTDLHVEIPGGLHG